MILDLLVWDWPTPRIDSSGALKQYPCGQGQTDNWAATFTDLTPGLQNVTVCLCFLSHFQFKETVVHRGSPVRIALSYGDDTRYDDFGTFVC